MKKDAADRVVDWFIVAVILLTAIPAMWATLPPSNTKTTLMTIMAIGDLYFWLSPVFVFVDWVKDVFGVG